MKVALVITRMVPGGAAEVVRRLLQHGGDRFDFTLFHGLEDLSGGKLDGVEPNCRIAPVASMRRRISPSADLGAYLALVREFRAGRFDVVHTHTSKAGVLGRLAARRAGIPRIVHSTHGTIHSPSPASAIPGVPSSRGFRRLLLAADQFVGRFTNKLAVLSGAERQLSLELRLAPPENIVVVPNGVEVEQFLPSPARRRGARRQMDIADDQILLLAIGRLAAEKGHAALLAAFRRLLADADAGEGAVFRLAIVGDGPERAALEAAAADLVAKRQVVFHGFDADVRKYLAAADLFVLPSLYEGFGIAMLEAMAAGLPIVASRVGGVPELLADGVNGLLVPPGDPESLAAAIAELAADPARRTAFGEANIARAANFSLEAMVNGYYELYA